MLLSVQGLFSKLPNPCIIKSMVSIRGLSQKCKVWLDKALGEWGMALFLIIITISSFGMGRLSALQEARAPVSVYEASMDARPRMMAPGGLLVAADSGNVYYYPWCAGAQKIDPTKQRWFSSEAAAQDAGYRPAKNCKGLQ